MNRKVILCIGASIVLIFALFHLAFWEIFNWNAELKTMSLATGGILQILNIVSVYVLFFFTVITVYIALTNKNDFLSNLMLVFIGGYFLVRVITGYFFFGWSITEFIIWLMCVLTASIFLYVSFISKGSPKSEPGIQK